MTAKRDERPRYRVTEKSFIDHNLIEAGGEVEYDGVPGSKLIPLNEAAEEAKELAPADIEAAQAKLARANAPISRVVTDKVDPELEKRLAERDAAHKQELEDQRKAHEKELAELREQAKLPKQTGGPADDENKDPTLVVRGGETEAADPVAGQVPTSDPNKALSKTQRQGSADASKGGEGKNDLV